MKEKLFAFKGRMNRKNYIVLSLLPILIILISAIPVMMKIFSMGNEVYDIGDIIFIPTYFGLLLGIWVSLAINIKRLHDINFSGFFVILNFIPYVNIILWILLMIIKGSNSDNKYGINTDENDNKVFYKIVVGIILTSIISIIMIMPFFVKALVDTNLNTLKSELHNYGVNMIINSDDGLINNTKKIELTITNNEKFINNASELISNNIEIININDIINTLKTAKEINKYGIKIVVNLHSNNYLIHKPKAEIYLHNYYVLEMTQYEIDTLEYDTSKDKNAEKDFKDKLEIYHPNIKKGIKIFDITFYLDGSIQKINLDYDDDDLFYIKGLEFFNKNKNNIIFKIDSYKNKQIESDDLIIDYSKDDDYIKLDFSQNNFKDANSSIDSISIRNNIKVKDFIDVNSKIIIDSASYLSMKTTFEKLILEFNMSSIDKNKFDTLVKAYSRSDKKDYRDVLNYSIYNILNDGLNIEFKITLLNLINDKVNHNNNEISFNILLAKNKLNVENTFNELVNYINLESNINLSKNMIQTIDSLPSDAPLKILIDKYKKYLHMNENELILIKNRKLEINNQYVEDLLFKEEYSGWYSNKDKFSERYIYVFCEDGLFDSYAVFSIDSGKILDGNLRTKHSEKFVTEWIISNRKTLEEQWNSINDNYVPKMFILK